MAATKGDGLKTQIKLLNGGNYMFWKTKVKMLLIRDELWDCVTATKPENPTEAWIKCNNKALARIILNIEDEQLVHVSELETANEVWQTLQRLYERSTFGSQLYLRRKLYSIRFMSGTMRAHINTMLEVVSLLRSAGTEFGTGELVAVLLCSLPDTYSGLVTALEGRDEQNLTVEYVTGKMLDEFQRRNENEPAKGDTEVALQASSHRGSHAKTNRREAKFKGKERRECFYCRKPGHLKAECYSYKKFLQQQSNKEEAKVTSRAQDYKDSGGGHVSFAAYERANLVNQAQWCVDSGATSHMTSDKMFFVSIRDIKLNVFLADNSTVHATGIGEGRLYCSLPNGKVQTVWLKDVLYVPKLDGSLLSVRRMTLLGFRVMFEDKLCTLYQGSKMVAMAVGKDNLFQLKIAQLPEAAHVASVATCIHQWHRRLGHRDPVAIQRLSSENLADGLAVGKCSGQMNCDHCTKGKLAQLPFPTSTTRAERPGDLIHSDVCGPMPTSTPSGNRYVLTFIDDHSRFTAVRLLKTKDQVAGVLQEYVAMVSNRFGRKPIAFRTDNGKEYVNRELLNFFTKEGIEHQLTIPYTPQQNGVAERKNRSLTETAKCLLLDSDLPNRFWGEAVLTAAYLQNRLPSRSVKKTPFEHWHGMKPDLRHIRVFGSKVFSLIPNEKRRKLDDKALQGVLIGFSDVAKGYRILDPKTNKVWISRSVRIIESESTEHHKEEAAPETEGVVNVEESTNDSEEAVDADFSASESEGDEPTEIEREQPPNPPARRSQRVNKGVPPQRMCLKVEVDHVREPTSWDEMVKLPPTEKHPWMAAAEEEIKALRDHQVWELTDLPEGRRAISSKWVFKAKLDTLGQVHKYKARLVARGFCQRYGQDYDETFAPVVRHETVRVFLAIAALRKLHVRHLDVKNAYLNGELEEELYMEQPQGFEEPGQETKVLRLRRSLYGLKQSARAWNRRATETLGSLGFKQGMADQCLFFRQEKDDSTTYVLVYVDDFLVAGTSDKVINRLSNQLNKHFQTKDLGEVKHYLGIQVERKIDGSFLLHQRTKIAQMLEEHGLLEPRPVATPMETGFLASAVEESKSMPNNTRYRQAIGSLLYIATVSRPDVAVAVGFLCRSVEAPTERDWKAVKRVMRYLGTTIDRKLLLPASGEVELRCYVDADWAGDKKDRKSTSGYIFQLGQSTVAWSSRKQTSVALSSTEAEYLAASNACRELLWLRQLLTDMGNPADAPTAVYEDNQGCIKLVGSDRCGARTKHIDVSHHFLRDLRDQGVLEMRYCPTEHMVADILTKPLCKELFERCIKEIGLQK